MKCEKCDSKLVGFHLFKKRVICHNCGHVNKRDFTWSEQRLIAKLCAGLFIIVVLLFGAFNQFMTRFETVYGQYDLDQCERIIKYDDGTISQSKDIYDKIRQYLKDKGFEITSQDEVYYLEDLFSSEVNIYASKDDINYTIYYSYEYGKCILKELSFTSSYEGELGHSLDYLNQEDYNYLASLLDYQDITDRFIDIYDQLKPHSENPGLKNVTVEENDYYLYIKEDSGEDYNHVLFEYRISNY